MRNYELMTIYKATLTDDKAKSVSKEISDVVVANKGNVTKTDFWGKKKFAYELKGAKEGYYDVLHVEIDPEGLLKLTSKLKLNENVLRYLFTTLPNAKVAEQTKN